MLDSRAATCPSAERSTMRRRARPNCAPVPTPTRSHPEERDRSGTQEETEEAYQRHAGADDHGRPLIAHPAGEERSDQAADHADEVHDQEEIARGGRIHPARPVDLGQPGERPVEHQRADAHVGHHLPREPPPPDRGLGRASPRGRRRAVPAAAMLGSARPAAPTPLRARRSHPELWGPDRQRDDSRQRPDPQGDS